MANAANIFNNTILIPTSGSPEDAPKATFGKDLQTYNKKDQETAIKTGAFRVFLNIGGWRSDVKRNRIAPVEMEIILQKCPVQCLIHRYLLLTFTVQMMLL